MITKKQRKSSRKAMKNRSVLRYFNRMASIHLSNTQIATAVKPRAQSSGYAASIKRASGRGN